MNTSLTILTLSKNCFTGTLPSNTLCTLIAMEELLFDGLHSSSVCVTRALPVLPNTGYIIPNAVYGSIPSCLFQLPNLLLLHLGSNSLSGSISDDIILSSSLQALVLSIIN